MNQANEANRVGLSFEGKVLSNKRNFKCIIPGNKVRAIFFDDVGTEYPFLAQIMDASLRVENRNILCSCTFVGPVGEDQENVHHILLRIWLGENKKFFYYVLKDMRTGVISLNKINADNNQDLRWKFGLYDLLIY